MTEAKFLPLEDLAQQFVQWRTERPNRRSPVPEALRQQAVALADAHRKSVITRTLGVSYTMLNQWLRSSCPEENASENRFIPLTTPDSFSARESLSLELVYDNGASLRLKGDFTPTQLTTLFQGLRPSVTEAP